MTPEERDMVVEIEELSGKLSDWEEGFVDSISRKAGELSERQHEVLVRLYEKVTSGPSWGR